MGRKLLEAWGATAAGAGDTPEFIKCEHSFRRPSLIEIELKPRTQGVPLTGLIRYIGENEELITKPIRNGSREQIGEHETELWIWVTAPVPTKYSGKLYEEVGGDLNE